MCDMTERSMRNRPPGRPPAGLLGQVEGREPERTISAARRPSGSESRAVSWGEPSHGLRPAIGGATGP